MLRSFTAPRAADTQRRRDTGQALVELALVAPIIILLLMSLIQFAFIFERQVGITNAVREAARRTAALETKNTEAQTNATWGLAELQLLLTNSQNYEASRGNIEVCIYTPSDYTTDVAGNAQVMVRITETYRHPLWLPLITQILDGIDGAPNDQSLAVGTSVTFRVEQAGTWNIGAGAYARTDVSNTSLCSQS